MAGLDGRPGLGTMDELGVELTVLSISSPDVHFGDDRVATVLARGVNEDGAALAARHPDRFGFFASLPPPDMDSALDTVLRRAHYDLVGCPLDT